MKTYQYKVKGVDYEVEIAEVEGNIAHVNVNGIPFEVELQKPINAARHPSLKPATPVAAPAPAPASPAAPAPAAPAPAAPAGAGNAVKAPLPGTVTEVKVQVGQSVKAGDVLLVLEAMKMQNNIESEFSGQVTSITVKAGDTVMEGSVIMTIA